MEKGEFCDLYIPLEVLYKISNSPGIISSYWSVTVSTPHTNWPTRQQIPVIWNKSIPGLIDKTFYFEKISVPGMVKITKSKLWSKNLE